MDKMKFLTLAAGLSILFLGSTAYAKDPCASLLCMMGKVQGGVAGSGSSADGCASPISDFMTIIERHHGHLDSSATETARRTYLNSCSGAGENTSAIDAIISAFGTSTL